MPRRSPERTHAYLVGGGIASLTAAVHLHHDARVPASQIHIIEAAPQSGGSMGRGQPCDNAGYVLLAARKLNFSYRCLYATLAKVPSARHPGQTVLDDVRGIIAKDDGGSHAGVEDAGESPDSEEFEEVKRPEELEHSINKHNEEQKDKDTRQDDTESSDKLRLHGLPRSARALLARLVDTGPDGPDIVDVTSMGLLLEQRMSLLRLILESEEDVGDGREIQSLFKPDFFESKFWDVWASLYGFQPWHSAIEFRRYLVRFLHEFSHISTLEGVDHAPMNDYECIILPMEQYLKSLGVDFQYETQVTGVEFAPGDRMRVCALHTRRRGTTSDALAETTVSLGDHDIVIITLGSMTAGVRFGTNDRPPPALPTQEAVLRDPGPVWRFWSMLADPATNPVHHAAFGRPQAFYGHVAKSSWLSFTITLAGAAGLRVFDRLTAWAGFSDPDETSRPSAMASSVTAAESQHSQGHTSSHGPLITFRDSPWMLSLAVPHQPYFTDQPDDVRVLWGYGLYPDQEGLFVRKPMLACTGAEIYAELAAHLNLGTDAMGSSSGNSNDSRSQPSSSAAARSSITTIPCLMPFIGSPFLPRSAGDRPAVVPPGSANLGLLGQFVEIERDVTFTMEYSARSAQMAVVTLMGLDEDGNNDGDERFTVPAVHRGDRDVQVLGEMLMTIMS